MMFDRNKIIEDNINLVHTCAKRFVGRGIEYDDLFGAGCVGLIKAADGFDESRGLCFSTYAVPMKCSLGKKERKTLGNGFKSSNIKGFRTFRLPIEFRYKPLQRK